MGSSLPEAARSMFRTMLDLLGQLNAKIDDLVNGIARQAPKDVMSRRLVTIPDVGQLRQRRLPPALHRPSRSPKEEISPLGWV